MKFSEQQEVLSVRISEVDVQIIGDPTILDRPLLGLFCSQKCPGELILKAYDLAKELRDRGETVISGFHSPIEKDMLAILLRGSQPIILCAARCLEHYRVSKDIAQGIADGRLAILAPAFKNSQIRISREAVSKRNELILRISSRILIVYAEPGGSVDRLCLKQLHSGHLVFAIASPKNDHLFPLGVKPWN